MDLGEEQAGEGEEEAEAHPVLAGQAHCRVGQQDEQAEGEGRGQGDRQGDRAARQLGADHLAPLDRVGQEQAQGAALSRSPQRPSWPRSTAIRLKITATTAAKSTRGRTIRRSLS